MAEPFRLTLSEMVTQIQRGKLSPVTLMESLLQRIDTLEPLVQAWVTIDREGILKEARRQHNEIYRGKIRGPLHGIPIGLKDIIYTAGMKTTGGSKILENFVPDFDATAVDRLKKAGAIILGKTATTEFASADPAPTCNPWNPDHTPGGSSSGSAAAVSACMCPAALGSQTGGSVLRPAAFCGVVGLKPTYGRISRYGVLALSWTLDHVGVLTRSVADAAILLGVLAGADPKDPTASQEPVSDYAREAQSLRKPPRLGLVRAFYREKSEESAWKHTEETLVLLQKAGARVEEVNMPASFSVVQDAHRIIMRTEGAAYHEKLYEKHKDQYRPRIRELVETGLLIPSTDYLRAQKIKRQFRREMEKVLQPFDCLYTPSTSSSAPRTLSTTGNPWFQAPWSFSGLPAISLPSGLDKEGLPLGIQLIGKPFAEGKLLAVARWCEKALKISLSPALG